MIGLFDSGSGVRSIFNALHAVAPTVDCCILTDRAHAPYGTQAAAALSERVRCILAFFRARGITDVVSACGSTSAAVVLPWRLFGGMPTDVRIVDTILPLTQALTPFRRLRIAVAATPATVIAGTYAASLAAAGMYPTMLPCAELAPAIDRDAPRATLASIVDALVLRAIAVDAELLVLGCTHFPLVRSIFEERLHAHGAPIALIDPASAVAGAITRTFGTRGSGLVEEYCSIGEAFERTMPTIVSELQESPFVATLSASIPIPRSHD